MVGNAKKIAEYRYGLSSSNLMRAIRKIVKADKTSNVVGMIFIATIGPNQSENSLVIHNKYRYSGV
jgi:hypothetical protein